jgi:hypothetical protein
VRSDAEARARDGNVLVLVAVELFGDELSTVGNDNIYELRRQSTIDFYWGR